MINEILNIYLLYIYIYIYIYILIYIYLYWNNNISKYQNSDYKNTEHLTSIMETEKNYENINFWIFTKFEFSQFWITKFGTSIYELK